MDIKSGAVVSSSNSNIIGEVTGGSGAVTVSGRGSAWTSTAGLLVGTHGVGKLNIKNGATARNTNTGIVGYHPAGSGEVTVSGAGSTWINDNGLFVGHEGQGVLNITGGGVVSAASHTMMGYLPSSNSSVTVSGAGSAWINAMHLRVGFDGTSDLYIAHGGLVTVGDELTIDNGLRGSAITMSTGGMLALYGDADDLLGDFLDLIRGTDAIRYWDDSIWDWADITSATRNEDYTLSYMTGPTAGDLDGYTVLTVNTIPEPATMSILGIGALAMLRRRRKNAP